MMMRLDAWCVVCYGECCAGGGQCGAGALENHSINYSTAQYRYLVPVPVPTVLHSTIQKVLLQVPLSTCTYCLRTTNLRPLLLLLFIDRNSSTLQVFSIYSFGLFLVDCSFTFCLWFLPVRPVQYVFQRYPVPGTVPVQYYRAWFRCGTYTVS